MRRIIKAELLLTRRCNLKCMHCGIMRDMEEEKDIEKWKKGLKNLKDELGCEFVPIYGAEPLMELERLCAVLLCMKEIGLKNTVITNGLLIDSRVAKRLIDSGMDSITVSVDSIKDNYLDKYSEIKSKKGLMLLLDTFRDLRDREVSLTITRQNFRELPEMVRFFSDKGIWISFDVIHWSKGQEGSKCVKKEFVEDLVFTEEDRVEISKVFREVLELKQDGYLVHMSELVIKMWMEGYPIRQDWVCNYKKVGWLTVDSNLDIYGCDDFQPSYFRNRYKLDELTEERFEEFQKEWIERFNCLGCFWATHEMSDEMVNSVKGGDYFRHMVKSIL